MQECGGVIIRFPPEESNSDKVTIRGPKDDVEQAKKQLVELAGERVCFLMMQLHSKLLNSKLKGPWKKFQLTKHVKFNWDFIF